VVHILTVIVPRRYVHRAGRTARAGKDGLSIALVIPGEKGACVHPPQAPLSS
jgi:hypothetical protein